jgi:RNA recognition motif-containing protein
MNVIIASDGLHYKAVQINGQKIVGPPLNFAVPQPSDNLEIFICSIPRDLTEEFLIKLFSRIGPIYELRLLMCFSGFNRGIAYIRYYNKRDVANAVKW